jgi:hypothetical protein
MHVGYWWESQKVKDHWEDRDVGGWIILRWNLDEYDGMLLSGLIWLRMGTGGGLL